ncbi:MAG: ATP-binding protein [Bacteroidales bacterium]|nr:ATP-binding protein [Bacteroidales bacterium]
MMKKKISNPFLYQGYESPDYFCDRVKETEALASHLRNGRNVTLISPRRIGKTGLIQNTFYHIREQDKEAICLYIDIFPTKSQAEMVRMLGNAVVNEVMSKNKSLKKKALDYFSAWKPVLSMDPLTGFPTLSLNIEPKQSEITLKGIFDYLVSLDKDVFIAIDEFQQVAEYPETGTEALLRSHIQFAQNVHFVFSGSKQHLMAEMFGSPQRPFYQSTETMGLLPLDENVYYDFANRFFTQKKGILDRQVFHDLYARFDGYTWYIQSVLNRLYEENRKVTTSSQLLNAIRLVMLGKATQYENIVQFLTDNQFSLLKAIAKERKVGQPTAQEFLQKHSLSSASSVQSALETLVNKELVYPLPDGYIIYDRFFDLWLQRFPNNN